ncbi:MAG: signal peptidase I [Clostridia bacterium]|nr:signal peptidase I [Clostridia bacterium]
MSDKVKKIWNAATSVLIALVVVLAILLAGMRLFGFNVFTVLSGSMEPVIHTGSIVYVKEVKPEDIRTGDVITYMLDENTISTHRVVEVIPDEEDPTVIRYKTKGDANASEDGVPVHCQNVIGEVQFSIPYLGYVANFIQNPPGMYVAIAAGLLLLILIFMPEILAPEKEKEKKKGDDKGTDENESTDSPENTTDAKKPDEGKDEE